jgi:hypothetical protein
MLADFGKDNPQTCRLFRLCNLGTCGKRLVEGQVKNDCVRPGSPP